MKRLWSRFIEWFTRPQREYVNLIFEMGKIAGRAELRIEQLNKENESEM